MDGSKFFIRKMLVAVALLAFLGAIVAGCGSSSSSSSSSSSESESAAPAEAAEESPATEESGSTATTAAFEELFEGTESEPPSTSPAPATGKEVWWISCGQEAPACSVPAKAAEEAAEKLGFKFKIADGKLNVGGGYAAAIRQAVAAKPDAILVHSMDCSLVKQPLEEAREAGIKTMAVEEIPCPANENPYTAEMKYSEKAPTADDYFENWGRLSAAYIAAQNPEATVLNNEMTDKLGGPIQKGFTEELAECSGCSIEESVKFGVVDLTPNGPWISSFRPALLKSEASATFMPFGVMMLELGGAKAIQESGKQMEIVGGNGESDAISLVKSGEVAACTGCHDSSWMGYGAMDEINRILDGEPTVPEGIGQRVVTKENVAELDHGPEGAYSSPIDWRAAYEKAWSGN
jgi:ribose transport system substrate-binding protein